jgi:hypothetical protein
MTTTPAPAGDRPFLVSDAMILVAALAVALIWDRGRIVDPVRWISSLAPGPAGLLRRVALGAANVLEFVPPFLAVVSVTVLGLRLRRPRPPLLLLVRQPGTVACAIASLGMVLATLAMLASHYGAAGSLRVAGRLAAADMRPEYLGGLTILIGGAIAVTWLVLKARRQWLVVPGWIDRLGRWLGAGWMLMILGVLFSNLIGIMRML